MNKIVVDKIKIRLDNTNLINGNVAQWLEQIAHNDLVVSSNLTISTNNYK